MTADTLALKELLSEWLAPLDSAMVECDGMSRAVSILLREVGIAHSVVGGKLLVDGDCIRPHFWVELDEHDLRIDYRARLWLRGNERVPHGIFECSTLDAAVEYVDEGYQLSRMAPQHIDGAFVFAVLTNATTNDFLLRLPAGLVANPSGANAAKPALFTR